MYTNAGRFIDIAAFLICIFLLASAAYLQYKLGLAPCPLCIIQRIIFVILGILFLMSIVIPIGRNRRRFIYSFIFLFSLLGAIVAGRQVWIEHMPAGLLISCEATLSRLMSTLPFTEVIQHIFQGTGQCARSNWKFLDLTIPEWTLIFFVFFTLISVLQILKKRF